MLSLDTSKLHSPSPNEQTENPQSSTPKQIFLQIKINCYESLSNDSMMSVVRSCFKAILWSCNLVNILAPSHLNLPAIQDNKNLPLKHEVMSN